MVKLTYTDKVHNYQWFKNSYPWIINNEGFGFIDRHRLRDSMKSDINVFFDKFYNSDYNGLLKLLNSSRELKKLTNDVHECILRIDVGIVINNNNKYIQLGFKEGGSLTEAIISMKNYKDYNLMNYMNNKTSTVVSIINDRDDEKDGFDDSMKQDEYLYLLTSNQTVNFFDLMPFAVLRSLRTKQVDKSSSEEKRIKKFSEKIYKTKFQSEFKHDIINMFEGSIRPTFSNDKNLKVTSILEQNGWVTETSFYDILKTIIYEILGNDDNNGDILSKFIDLLLIMSINQIQFTRKMTQGSSYKNVNFLNWYFYIDMERRIMRFTDKSFDFFLKLYYGNFFNFIYKKDRKVNFIKPFFTDISFLRLDRASDYEFKEYYEKDVLKSGVNLNLEGTSYERLIDFFIDNEKYLSKNIVEKFEEFMTIKLEKEKICFGIVFNKKK